MRQTNSSFGLTNLGLHVLGEENGEKRRRREEEEEEEEEEGEKIQAWFCLESCVFWISRVFGMDFHRY